MKKAQTNKLLRKIVPLLGILFVSGLAIYPMFKSGFYRFHDEPNIAHLHQMIRSLGEGNFPPRWIPDSTYNYGNPYYNYFYHLPFYVGSFFYFVFGLSIISSMKASFVLATVLSVAFFYLLMRLFFRPSISFAAAGIYLFTPYRAVDLYVRGAIGEVWGFVFMPLIVFSFLVLDKKQTGRTLGIAAISIAGLILSHNSSAFLFLPFSALMSAFLILVSSNRVQTLKSFLIAYTLGFGLSAYYWIPVVMESKFIQPGSPFNVIDHFPFIKQLIIPSWGYGASIWGILDGMSFQIGLINISLVVIAFASFLNYRTSWSRLKTVLFLFGLGSFTFVIFLMNIRSMFLWNAIPFSSYVQFPWRFLMLTTFFSAFLSGFAFDLVNVKFKKLHLPLLVLALTIVLTWSYFKPERAVDLDDNFFLRKFFINMDSEGRTDNLSKVYVNNGEDYLPKTIWTEERPERLPVDKIQVEKGTVSFVEVSSTSYKAIVISDEETILVLNSFYFPGWKAWVDGQETNIIPRSPFGDITVEIEPGEHSVEIKFTDTPTRTNSNLLSVISIFAIIVLLVLPRYNRSGFRINNEFV